MKVYETLDTTSTLEHEAVDETLASWVWARNCEWERDYKANYEQNFKRYYRLWRGIWSSEDKKRESERSRLVSPALQQAVESNVAEVEEATFGRGEWFDLRDNLGDESNTDIEGLRNMLLEEFEKRGIRKAIGEVLINAAVFGTGVAEVVLETVEEQKARTQPVMDGQLTAFGVQTKERTVVGLVPILPQNFRIDPATCNVRDALGCAVDSFVGTHRILELQEAGVYDADIELEQSSSNTDLEADPTLASTGDHTSDRVRVVKYFGKVPTDLLRAYVDDEALKDEGYYTEAEVVLVNDGQDVLKAQKNPNLFKGDRAIIAFSWDVVPGRFWGRGVCEKGSHVQAALDTEIRARIDNLALTTAPMMAMDANKKVRGASYAVVPGKVWLTQGNPAEAFMPLNIGDVKQSSFVHTNGLQTMLQQATGAVDATGVSGGVNGEATAAGISMSLGAIIKRHKRTLVNFHQGFLVPFVEKAAFRYMQHDPETFGFGDYSFNATGTSGIMAREYEVTQLGQLLQSMPPDSPMYPELVKATVDSMSLNNRESLIQTLEQAQQPNPEAQKQQQVQQEAALRFQNAQSQALEAQAMKDQAEAAKKQEETRAIPEKIKVDLIRAASVHSEDDKEFNQKVEIAKLALEETKINLQKNSSKALDKMMQS